MMVPLTSLFYLLFSQLEAVFEERTDLETVEWTIYRYVMGVLELPPNLSLTYWKAIYSCNFRVSKIIAENLLITIVN